MAAFRPDADRSTDGRFQTEIGVTLVHDAMVVTVTASVAASIARPACVRRRPAPDDSGLHAALTLDNALSGGVTLTGRSPFVPHENTAVGVSELLDLTMNTSSPTSPVSLSTATLTSAM